jgi:hypothetical protein
MTMTAKQKERKKHHTAYKYKTSSFLKEFPVD